MDIKLIIDFLYDSIVKLFTYNYFSLKVDTNNWFLKSNIDHKCYYNIINNVFQ